MLLLVPAISQTHKSLENSQDFFVKTKTKTKTLGFKTKTLFFVLEAPRDQDFGLEDYITDYNTKRTSLSPTEFDVAVEEQVGNSSFAVLFNGTWQQTAATARAHNPVAMMSKHSDDEMSTFHFLTNLILCCTLNLTILNTFSRQLRTYLPLRSSRYDTYNARYRLSKFSYFDTLVDCTQR